MNKTIVLIDGFNLYHSLYNRYPYVAWKNYRWLDLKKLSEQFLKNQDILLKVYYFTAIASWNNSKAIKHNNYIKALKDRGVDIVEGKFKKVQKKCLAKCKMKYLTHEEKETDVNMALFLLKEAYDKNYDKAIIISGDSDLIPAIKIVKKQFPNIIISTVVPKNGNAMLNIGESGTSCRLSEKHLKNSLLSNPYIMKNKSIIHAPDNWL